MTPLAQNLTTLISLGVILADICIVILAFIYFFGSSKNKLGVFVSKNALVLSTVISVGAMIGSLLYSSVIGFVPCELCWWQRIFLFSQAVIFFIAWIKALKIKHKNPDTSLFLYSLVLSVIGACIALFHYYGQMFNPGALAACEANGISCAKLYFVSFGYITIPMMALSTFLLLVVVAAFKLRSK